MKSDVIDLKGVIHHSTERAILFSLTGDRDDAVWLPKSQIEIDESTKPVVVTLPEWLAIDQELV